MSASTPIVLSISFVAAFIGSVPFLVGQTSPGDSMKCPNCPVVQLAPVASAESSVVAGGKSDARKDVYSETQLLGSIDALRNAMVRADTNLLKAHASTALSFGHSNGHVQSLEEFAETISSGEEVFKRVDLTGRKVEITGNTAVARHHFSADIVYKGELKVFELEIVQVWKKTDRWRLAVRQAYKT